MAQARDWLSSYWSGYNSPSQLSRIRNTGVPLNFLKEVSSSSSFNEHGQLVPCFSSHLHEGHTDAVPTVRREPSEWGANAPAVRCLHLCS